MLVLRSDHEAACWSGQAFMATSRGGQAHSTRPLWEEAVKPHLAAPGEALLWLPCPVYELDRFLNDAATSIAASLGAAAVHTCLLSRVALLAKPLWGAAVCTFLVSSQSSPEEHAWLL